MYLESKFLGISRENSLESYYGNPGERLIVAQLDGFSGSALNPRSAWDLIYFKESCHDFMNI